jgi:hypothetical protein
MTIYRFEAVTLTGQKTVKCDNCGKWLRRQRTFQQTLNPYNKNAQGELKSRREMNAELNKAIAAWRMEPETCQGCRS